MDHLELVSQYKPTGDQPEAIDALIRGFTEGDQFQTLLGVTGPDKTFTMAKHFDKQFKLDAVQYYHDHRELGLVGCASNLGISQQSLSRWQKELRESGDLKCRGSGNYSSDEAKEIARLKRELRDAKDALKEKKKAINILGE